jgi:penicillin-binding protein 1C
MSSKFKSARFKKIAHTVRSAAQSKFFSSRFMQYTHTHYRRLILYSIGIVIMLLALYTFWDLPSPLNLTTNPAPASTKLLDRRGRPIYEIFTTQRRTPIKLSSLPDYVWQSTLSAEDKDFYKHGGFDLRGMARAFINTFFHRQLQGGSTITQQLVRTALLNQDRTLRRKVREFTLSVAVETLYKKNDILEMYLNQVPYGGTAYGLESAAQTYFGKPARELTLAQAALLAGLTQAPSYYSPFGSHPELAKERQKYVLTQMLANNYITKDQHDQAEAEPLKYAPPPTIRAPHFSLWVKDLLVQKYGLQAVEQGGLIVTTTLDLDLQNFAQDAVATEVGKLKRERVGNGAALVTNPQTGEILAMVGSKDYFNTEDDGNVNVTLSHRQPGSSIKPINYAIAIERKLITPSTVLSDKPTCFIQPDQKDPYCPTNYDNQFHGPTQVRFALANSFNIPAVKTLVINGLSDFVASASAFGITTFQDPSLYGPSITLGGGEVTMTDMATAYGVFADAGKKVSLNPILEVQDYTGKILESAPAKKLSDTEIKKAPPYSTFHIGSDSFTVLPPSNTRVISTGTAFLISHILYDNGARAATFGQSSYLNIAGHPEVSVKTGTTNDKKDNWTIGYNPDILVAVWVGNNDSTSMSNVASGVTGASPIWNKVMSFALKGTPQHWPVQPADIVGSLVCSLSGLKAPDNPDPATCSPRYEYFLSGTIPPVDTGIRRDLPIYKPSNTIATSKQIIENSSDVEYQNHSVISDPLGTLLCLDCPGGFGPADNIRLDRSGKAVH